MNIPKQLKVLYNPDRAELSEITPKIVTFDDNSTPTIDDLVFQSCKAFEIDQAEVANYQLKMVKNRLLFNDSNTAFAMQEVMLVNIIDEVKEVVLKLEDIVQEIYQKASVKTLKDIVHKNEVNLENKNFLAELTKNFELKNDIYIEEFIALGGSNQLMSLAVLLDGSLLGNCLK